MDNICKVLEAVVENKNSSLQVEVCVFESLESYEIMNHLILYRRYNTYVIQPIHCTFLLHMGQENLFDIIIFLLLYTTLFLLLITTPPSFFLIK